jgi:hypothetical protein
MASYPLVILLILVMICISAGCLKEQEPGLINPAPGNQNDVDLANQSLSKDATVNQTAVQTTTPTQVQTPIMPVQTVAARTLPPLTPIRQDPVIVFRDQTVLILDNLQAKKEGVLRSYRLGNYTQVKLRAEDFKMTLRRESTLENVPSKMDYIRVSYYDYIDRAGQCAESFAKGADRWLVNDTNSANSYCEAGIIASERADIADKRMRTFFRDYVQQAQVNRS